MKTKVQIKNEVTFIIKLFEMDNKFVTSNFEKNDKSKSGMGMYLVGWGCIWWDGDENNGFGDNLGIKLVGRLFFVSIIYTKKILKIRLQNVPGGMRGVTCLRHDGFLGVVSLVCVMTLEF